MEQPATSIELVLKWTKKAMNNCKLQGKKESALLWSDALEHLKYQQRKIAELGKELEQHENKELIDSLKFAEKAFGFRVDVAAVKMRQLEAENKRLADFANEILQFSFDGSDPDGGEIQDIAVKHGLLVEVERMEPCGEHCVCAEFGFPAMCYEKQQALKNK